MSRLNFQLLKEATGSKARAAVFHTLHNRVETPVFMPVGTHATVRGQQFDTLESLGFPVLLANTYHLMLRPGAEVFEKMGGIQKFMGWSRSVLTDSGGFQIFSLPNDRVMSEEGALFRSYVDNRPTLLTPEKSIEMQKAMKSDIMMVLDQCIPSTAEYKEAEAAMLLTHRWAARSLAARGDSPQSIFGIVQGACFSDLRRQSADVLTSMPFDGFAIGGLAVGESKNERDDMTELAASFLPRHLPRYLMGVGKPLDLLEAVHRGVDMFDCILPNALGEQGVAFTTRGRMDIRRSVYKFSEEPLDPACGCRTCTRHSVAYLHHLIRVRERSGCTLVANHNLTFYANLMKEIRSSILNDSFLEYYHAKKEILGASDGRYPGHLPKKSKRRQRPRQLGDYSIVETMPGIYTVRHDPSGEKMHSVNDPMEEARGLYVQQSALAEKLCRPTEKSVVIWDIGLGAGINAMAAIVCAESQKGDACSLHVVSFENDLNSFRLALQNQNLFPHLRHAAPVTLLEKHYWCSKNEKIKWTLFEGDFQTQIEKALVPDVIFFDPFSLKANAEAWAFDSFRQIFEICKDHPTELYTYSSSTAVRASLLGAGFFVASGVATGPREETTVALTPKAEMDSYAILPAEWLARWERSHVKFPGSVETSRHTDFERRVRDHAQFNLKT